MPTVSVYCYPVRDSEQKQKIAQRESILIIFDEITPGNTAGLGLQFLPQPVDRDVSAS